MEFGDSRNALFVEPNAYIQKFEKEKKETKKIIFQEPYECLPNFYIDNNFTKKNCNCVNKHKQRDCSEKNKDEKLKQNKSQPSFDLKTFLTLLAGLNKGSVDFSSITNMLSNNNQETGGGFSLSNIISSLMSNPNGLSNILNLFKGNLSGKSKTTQKLKTTDFQIKNYTKVE